MKNWLTGVNEDELANLWKTASDALIKINAISWEKGDTPDFPEALYRSFCKAMAMLDESGKTALLSDGQALALVDLVSTRWTREFWSANAD